MNCEDVQSHFYNSWQHKHKLQNYISHFNSINCEDLVVVCLRVHCGKQVIDLWENIG